MKAIVIRNRPKNCYNCEFIKSAHFGNRTVYGCELENELVENVTSIPKWCPMKPIPKRDEIYEKFYQWYGLGNDDRYQSLRQLIDDYMNELLGEEK